MKFLNYIFLLTLSVSLASCSDDPGPYNPEDKADRTVLVYMADDGTLSSFMDQNIIDMQSGMLDKTGNLIVYRGTTVSPRLFKIEPDGTQTTLRNYENRDAADASVIREVINEVFTEYPASSYGLIFSGHGTGWEVYTAPALASSRSVSMESAPYTQSDMSAPALTKSFASKVNIDDLAGVLPVGRTLDFILFDACFMSGIEVLYPLRNAAKYIIASPTETMGAGFPYTKVIPLVFTKALQLKQICQTFVDTYRMIASYPSASVALVNTAQLEALAETVKTIFITYPEETLDLSTIQALERKFTHTFFDLDDYLAQLTGEDATYQAFKAQLAKVVEFEDHTDKIYSALTNGSHGEFDLDQSCGISTFIIQAYPGWKAAYLETDWAQAVGLE